MTPYLMKKTLLAMRSDLNAIAVSAIGVNKAVNHWLAALNNDIEIDETDSNEMALALNLFATALESFQEHSKPFIGDDQDESTH